ncbi:transglycosylase family protein [Specibacter sp. NPDC057265]|uniref:transglycosylase family protein n=1 Tax=Specibacter sp. NPDC057265 TaxID=3346075 RepID=UPI003645B2E1
MSSPLPTKAKPSYLTLACQGALLLALVAGVLAFATGNKSITLVVDGSTSSVQVFGGSVADALKRADVAVAAADHITPALDAPVQDGGTITVDTAKDITVSLDGAERTVTTTSHRISGLMNQLGIGANAEISVPADKLLAASDNVSIITPKQVTVVADGKKTLSTTTAATVEKLLEEAEIKLAATDLVSAPKATAVVENMVIKVTRVNTAGTETTTVAVPFETEESVDAQLFKDEKKTVREGVAGSVEKSFRTVAIDGVVVSRTETGSAVKVEPVSAKISIGAKERPAAKEAKEAKATGANTGASAPAMSNEAMWDAIAQCESTGNWSINNGNGYYGGLQFDIQTWLGAGGGEYAPNASLATKAQQIDIANRVHAQRGLSAWGCAHMVR